MCGEGLAPSRAGKWAACKLLAPPWQLSVDMIAKVDLKCDHSFWPYGFLKLAYYASSSIIAKIFFQAKSRDIKVFMKNSLPITAGYPYIPVLGGRS